MLKELQKQRKDNQSGFTIIEVMIVLAIAGVIMMLVFLAIPSLQRNNRNTQYRNDVANILGYVSEFTSNNNGALPVAENDVVEGDGEVSFTAPDGSTSVVGTIRGGTTADIVSSTSSDRGDTENIVLVLGADCDGNNVNTTGAGSRSIAASYFIETAGGSEEQCQAN